MTPARRPTLKDVAARAGLSVMVASYTFSRPDRVSTTSRTKILHAAEELGYRPHRSAQALRTGRTGQLGVVFSEHLGYAFRDPQAASFLAGVADICVDRGVGLTLVPTGGSLEHAQTVGTAAVDGFIFWTTTADDPALAEAISTDLPIAIQGGPDLPGTTRVGIDDAAAATAVAAAALHGASHPLVLSFPAYTTRIEHRASLATLDDVELPVTRARLSGVTQAVIQAGLNPTDVACHVLTHNSRHAARTATQAYLDSADTIDAIIAFSDEIALGARDAITRHGLAIPSHVSITGFDDSAEAEAAELTTIAQDLQSQGRLCAAIALGERIAANGTAPWRLVIRDSTRA